MVPQGVCFGLMLCQVGLLCSAHHDEICNLRETRRDGDPKNGIGCDR